MGKEEREYFLFDDGTYRVTSTYEDIYWDYPTEYDGKKISEVIAMNKSKDGTYSAYLFQVRQGELLELPESYKGVPVTSVDASDHELGGECDKVAGIYFPPSITCICSCGFMDWSLTMITIPDTVKEIGSNAFYNCTELRDVRLPKGLTGIKEQTFQYCESLREIELPDTVEYIGDYAFEMCTALREIKLPAALKSVGELAFSECTALNDVVIPAATTEIHESAFQDAKVKRFVVDEKNPVFCVIDGSLYYRSGKIHTKRNEE